MIVVLRERRAMPNLLNQKLVQLRERVQIGGIGSLTNEEFHLMVTRPIVTRYDDEPEVSRDYRDEIRLGVFIK